MGDWLSTEQSKVSFNRLHNSVEEERTKVYGRNPVKELWAVMNKDNEVLYTRGGSSTNPKLMVYPTESTARRALRNPWIDLDENMVKVVCIYSVSK